ncbi:MAG: hypothetical protein RL637_1728 [Pseudomonadota bacterium]|jgi:hypothetical protein
MKDKLANDEFLHFIHITKTAGGSLIQSLINAPSLADKIVHANNRILRDLDESIYQNKRILFGHFPFGIHTITQKSANYAAFFRHPITRVISHYHQLYQVDQGYIGRRIRAEGQNINEYFQTQHYIHDEFMDFYMKNLLDDLIIPETRETGMSFFDKCQLSRETGIELALQRLHQLRFIGIQEFYELSMIYLAEFLQIPFIEFEVKRSSDYAKRVNATVWELKDIEPKTLEIIKQKNQIDCLLYEEALKLFFTRYR